jgi:hypothetical protein
MSKKIFAVEFSFYTRDVCNGSTVMTALAQDGLEAINIVKDSRERLYRTKFDQFLVKKVESVGALDCIALGVDCN